MTEARVMKAYGMDYWQPLTDDLNRRSVRQVSEDLGLNRQTLLTWLKSHDIVFQAQWTVKEQEE